MFEARDDNKFALKQKASGLYVGFNDKVPEPVKFAPKCQTHELFSYSILASGLMTINNYRGYHLSSQEGKLYLAYTTTLN